MKAPKIDSSYLSSPCSTDIKPPNHLNVSSLMTPLSETIGFSSPISPLKGRVDRKWKNSCLGKNSLAIQQTQGIKNASVLKGVQPQGDLKKVEGENPSSKKLSFFSPLLAEGFSQESFPISPSRLSPTIDHLIDDNPISISNRDWLRLCDVMRSQDGLTGIYFLYFIKEGKPPLKPSLCLKISDNPFAEYMAASIFKHLDLDIPATDFVLCGSPEYDTLLCQIDLCMDRAEQEGKNRRADRLYSFYRKLKEDSLPGCILLMECIEGKNLEEVKHEDWSYEKITRDEFYLNLGKGLAADALILNGDRFPYLFSENYGNYRISSDSNRSLVFIDQSVDSMRQRYPLLSKETLKLKFRHLLRQCFVNDENEHAAKKSEAESVAKEIVDTLVLSSTNKELVACLSEGESRDVANKSFVYNYLASSLRLPHIIGEVAAMFEKFSYDLTQRQKDQIESGMRNTFFKASKIDEEVLRQDFSKITDFFLKDHPLLRKPKGTQRACELIEAVPMFEIYNNLHEARFHMQSHMLRRTTSEDSQTSIGPQLDEGLSKGSLDDVRFIEDYIEDNVQDPSQKQRYLSKCQKK